MLTEGMVYWLWLYSAIPVLLVLLSISIRKAKAVRRLVSQHAAAVYLSCEALIFFLMLWYRVTGIRTKIFTSKEVTAARAVSLNNKVDSISTVFVWMFKFSERVERKKKKNTNPTFLFKLFKIKNAFFNLIFCAMLFTKSFKSCWVFHCNQVPYFTVIRSLICVYN